MIKGPLEFCRGVAGILQDWTSQDTSGVPTGNIEGSSFSYNSICNFTHLVKVCPQKSITVHRQGNTSEDTFVHRYLQESCRILKRLLKYLNRNASYISSAFQDQNLSLSQDQNKSKTRLVLRPEFLSSRPGDKVRDPIKARVVAWPARQLCLVICKLGFAFITLLTGVMVSQKIAGSSA